MDNEDPYCPCPCGSGKKYKFCCFQKQREKEASGSGPLFFSVSSMRDSAEYLDETVLVGDMEEGRRLCEKGLRLMADGKFEEAVPLFRESTVEAPFVYTAANNLALCLLVTGKLDEAIRVQRENLKVAPFPNRSGWPI